MVSRSITDWDWIVTLQGVNALMYAESVWFCLPSCNGLDSVTQLPTLCRQASHVDINRGNRLLIEAG